MKCPTWTPISASGSWFPCSVPFPLGISWVRENCRQYQELEDTVTVYRGVTSYNAKNIKALSWTLDRETAEWFAHRFGEEGTIYEAQVRKEHILALFTGRNESEVIVDPRHLEQIMESPEPGFDMHMT